MSELLTVSEVAGILRVDDTTVRRWVKQDDFWSVDRITSISDG